MAPDGRPSACRGVPDGPEPGVVVVLRDLRGGLLGGCRVAVAARLSQEQQTFCFDLYDATGLSRLAVDPAAALLVSGGCRLMPDDAVQDVEPEAARAHEDVGTEGQDVVLAPDLSAASHV